MGAENYQRRDLSEVRYIVVHHSGVNVDSTPMEIARYHADVLGWPGIGYHFVANWNGAISYTGDLQTIRYNVAGRNRECIGVCAVGDWTHQWPWPTQLNAVHRLIRWLHYKFPGAEIVGHGEIALPSSPTSCPGNTWSQWQGQIS